MYPKCVCCLTCFTHIEKFDDTSGGGGGVVVNAAAAVIISLVLFLLLQLLLLLNGYGNLRFFFFCHNWWRGNSYDIFSFLIFKVMHPVVLNYEIKIKQ